MAMKKTASKGRDAKAREREIQATRPLPRSTGAPAAKKTARTSKR